MRGALVSTARPVHCMTAFTQADIAVLIPTFNEAARIGNTLAGVRAAGLSNITVIDGGSHDDTVAVARAASPGLKVVHAQRGRGTQLAAGVDATRAPVVLMLHADTTLPDTAVGDIATALADTQVVGGAFRQAFTPTSALLDYYAWWSRYESVLTTFGDQAIFCRRDALGRAGGLARTPLLEDVMVRKALRRQGRFVKLASTVITSARRFERIGPLACQARNAAILAAFHLGVPVHTLARFYGCEPTLPTTQKPAKCAES